MLSERQLRALLALFEARMQGITDKYLALMGGHLKAIGGLKPSDAHRLTEMRRMGANVRTIQQDIARSAEANVADLAAVFGAVAAGDQEFAQQWFGGPSRIKGAPKNSTAIERVLKAQLRVTAQAFKNLSQTTIQSTAYREAVDVAIQTVQTGVTDYASAIRGALRAAGNGGLSVQYPSGLTRRLDSAVRQNVLDGVRSLNNDILGQLGNEYGADGVELSAHALCAEDHLPYQGRQFSRKAFERLQASLPRPIGMWNCKHTIFPVVLGVSEPAHTPEELAAYARNSREAIEIDGRVKTRYEWTQEQRRTETAIRRQKDVANLAKASGDDVLRREAQSHINTLQEHYARISAGAGLTQQPERAAVAGFQRVKTIEELKGTPKYAILKTQQNREWLKRGYNYAVSQGDLSALTGFDHYMKVAEEVERRLVGSTTSDGLEIKGYVTHFIDRIIGSYEKRREGVSIDDILDALANPKDTKDTQRPSGPGRQYITMACKVVINPNTNMLIQVSPKNKEGV